jgi:hypothetical protein
MAQGIPAETGTGPVVPSFLICPIHDSSRSDAGGRHAGDLFFEILVYQETEKAQKPFARMAASYI